MRGDIFMGEFNYVKIGNRLKKIREYMGLTQEQVATILNIGRDAIIRIEKGTRKIDIEELLKFSKLYNISLEELTDESYIEDEEVMIFARGFEKLTEKDRKEILDLIELKNKLKSQ